MKRKRLVLPAIVMIGLLFGLLSCNKQPVTNPSTGNRVILNLLLAESYIAVSEIDSAVIWWETGAEKQYYKIIGLRDTLKADLSSFRKGDGTLTIQLFTKKLLNSQPLQFERRMNGRLSYQDAIFISGPSSISDPGWNPRIILSYELTAGKRYTGIVGLRVSDPYFEIKHIGQGYATRLKVYRGFYKTGEQTPVAGKTWDSQAELPVNQVNREFFLTLPQDISNAPWQTGIIEVTFYTSPTSAAELAYVFDKM